MISLVSIKCPVIFYSFSLCYLWFNDQSNIQCCNYLLQNSFAKHYTLSLFQAENLFILFLLGREEICLFSSQTPGHPWPFLLMLSTMVGPTLYILFKGWAHCVFTCWHCSCSFFIMWFLFLCLFVFYFSLFPLPN